MIHEVKPSKAIRFSATSKLYMEAGVKTSNNEERIKIGMAILVKVLDGLSKFRGHRVATDILEEIRKVREM